MPYEIIKIVKESATALGLAVRKAVGAGPAGETVYFEVDATQPDNAVGPVLVSQPLAALPTAASPQTVFAHAVALEHLYLINNTGVSRFVTITDGSGSPVPILPVGYDLGPWGILNMVFPGMEVLAGLKWRGDAGIFGSLKGYRA